jgi:hypothetical protein
MEPTTLLPIISLLLLVSVEYGGWSLLGFLTGRGQLGEFREQFFRAGHAHAGVLLVPWERTPLASSASVGADLGAAIGRNARPGR